MPFRIPPSSSIARPPPSNQSLHHIPHYPSRYLRPSCLSSSARHFRSSACNRAQPSNHYETLGISSSASQSEIKKQYYTLSKSTHPDRNPNDPTAASRFSAVSDAYAVLGNPDQRARYDRDVLRKRDPVPRQGSHSSSQSGFSSSGMNKSKSPFRGPPRSFYESGGYGKGKHAGRRAEEAERTAANARRRAGDWYTGGGDTGTAGGFSPGQGAPRGFEDDVPHFDREGHYRTQESVTGRRRVREEDIPEYSSATGFGWGAFFIISAATGTAVLTSALVYDDGRSQRERK